MISSHHFAARSAEPFVFSQDTLRQTVGKLGYLQATAPVLTAGAEADDIIHGGRYTCQRFWGGKCKGVGSLKLGYQMPG